MNYLKGWCINYFSKADLLLWDSDEDNWYNLCNSSMSTPRDSYLLKEIGKDKKNWFPAPPNS